MTNQVEILTVKLLSIQVCAPDTMSGKDIIAATEAQHPCGTKAGWIIVMGNDPILAGTPARVVCQDDPARVHIILTC